MTTPAFLELLKSRTPECQGNVVTSFGNVTGECVAAVSQAAACILPKLVRFRATGKDRAAFLHNFCTNDVRKLASGEACEAIFTDVKARVLGHGYILAGETCHEIWMLPGDGEALLNHLTRYIITEDVTIEDVSEGFTALLLAGAESETAISNFGAPKGEPLSHHTHGEVAYLRLNWKRPCTLACVADGPARNIWNGLLDAGFAPAGCDAFDFLRIQEGFPRVGLDLTSDHLAPESGRVDQAISYVKGCYLGQEPIARIDALGHVNRKLYCVEINDTMVAPEENTRNRLTSQFNAEGSQRIGIAMLTAKEAESAKALTAETTDGTFASVTVCQ